MLRADRPMEALRVDSKDIYTRGKSEFSRVTGQAHPYLVR